MVLRGLVGVLLAVAITSESRPACADAAEVEALIAKGNELRRAGTPGPALPYFQKAYELARSPRTAGQLGLAELAAGYPVDAAEHLAAALQTPDDPSIAKYRKMLTDALSTARAQIGELALQGNPAGAEVLVDGRPAGVLPLSAPIKLAAHNTEVVVRAPGYEPHRELVPIIGGQRHALTITLQKTEKPAEGKSTITAVPSPTSPSAAPPATSPPVIVDRRAGADDDARGSSSGLRTGAWIVGGGAVVALGAGLVLNLASRSNSSDFDGSCVNMNGIHMVTGPLSQMECVDRYNAWQSDRRWSIVGYVTGTALAVTSGILFWASRPVSPSVSVHAGVACAPTPAGVSCEGRF
jgi:hypothetical protein